MLAALLFAAMIITSPLSAASSTTVTHFGGLIAPAAWGALLPLPGQPSTGPGPFPPPPLVVLLIPIDGHVMTDQGAVQTGVLVSLIVFMTDPVTHMPTLSFVGNSTGASFQVDPRLTSASLTATVQGFDLVSFSQKTVTITVSWTATSPLTGALSPIVRTDMTNRVQIGDFSLFLHVSSMTRLATASGTLSLNGGPAMPLPPTPAAIARADVGTITRTALP